MSDELAEGLKPGRKRVPIKEAAERLGVSSDTIRRRLKAGELIGEREPTAQGFVWRVELPAEVSSDPGGITLYPPGVVALDAVELATLRERVVGLERLTDELTGERDAWRDQATRDGEAARELRILLQQAHAFANALPVTTVATPDDHVEASGRGEPSRGGDEALTTWQRLRRRLGGV